ncbi:MAG TPA: hypothetical protein VEM36_01965 [Xanthobacteraceae bacterium]|nr:hypothetical protein [Xanthobacteraceae bacterium]
MRRLFLALMMYAAIGPAAADIALSANVNVPDHVVTLVEHSIHRKEDNLITVMHHGSWTRTDTIEGRQQITRYIARGGAAEISIYPLGTDYFNAVFTSPGGERTSYWDTNPSSTNERRTILGESCLVWNMQRPRRPGPWRIEKLSCVTDDGIELSYARVSDLGVLTSAEATHIARQPVEPNEVQPPRALLALDWWGREESAPDGAPPTPDYETVMQLEGQAVEGAELFRITTRHHYPWTYIEEKKGKARLDLRILHATAQMLLSFSDNGEQKQLTINKSRPRPLGIPAPAPSMKPQDLNSDEIVLGESCHWFFMTPGVEDAALNECLTNDHITLKKETWS